MEVKAQLNYLRIAPRKMRLVADMIRGEKATRARELLRFALKKGALNMAKLLDSAMANANNNFQLDKEGLFIKEVRVDEGVKLKRWHAMSKGRATPIQKKTSHITLILEGMSLEKQDEPRISKEQQIKAKKMKQGERKKKSPDQKEKRFKATSINKKVFRRKAF